MNVPLKFLSCFNHAEDVENEPYHRNCSKSYKNCGKAESSTNHYKNKYGTCTYQPIDHQWPSDWIFTSDFCNVETDWGNESATIESENKDQEREYTPKDISIFLNEDQTDPDRKATQAHPTISDQENLSWRRFANVKNWNTQCDKLDTCHQQRNILAETKVVLGNHKTHLWNVCINSCHLMDDWNLKSQESF